MKKLIASSIFILLFSTCIFSAPLPSILGIKLEMKEDTARKILQKMGKQQKEEKKEEEEEGGEEEIWVLNGNSNYDSLIVGFDRKHLVRYVSVFAGKKGGSVRYSSIGNVKEAKFESNSSNYRYTWNVAAKGKTPHFLVIARGTDKEFLSSYSIKKF